MIVRIIWFVFTGSINVCLPYPLRSSFVLLKIVLGKIPIVRKMISHPPRSQEVVGVGKTVGGSAPLDSFFITR